MKYITALIIVTLLMLSSCYYDAVDTLYELNREYIEAVDTVSAGFDTTQAVSFASHVMPLLENNCATPGCHNGDMPPNLTNYQSINVWVERIVVRINNEVSPMPPLTKNNPLSETEIYIIEKWYRDGAPDN